ncbi:unnamed protein product [Withania somnifera]
MRYRVAKASELLVITGIGIIELKITKKALKLPFLLPAVSTIGPCVVDLARLTKYAKLLSHHERDSHDVKDLVQGVIGGEICVLAASMTMEEIFKGTKDFKKEVFDKGQKTQMEAAKQAKIDVAEAKMKGDIGSKEREGLTSVAVREAILQQEVERKNALTNTESLKAEHLCKATVDYEIKVQDANSVLYKKQKEAEAELYENKKAAEAKKLVAEAQTYSLQLAADAALYAKKKEAEGLQRISEEEGFYVRNLLSALGGNYNALRDYMMIDRGMFKDMAKFNAEVIKGLEPKISIWTNGGQMVDGTSSGQGGIKEVASVYKLLPPLFETVHEQTGMLPPARMGSLSVSAADPATSNQSA